MGMKVMPKVTECASGKYWEHEFEKFFVGCYVPDCDLMADVINYGFKAPYLVLFTEEKLSMEQAIKLAEKKGFADTARKYATSVCFVFPTCGNWDNAPYDLYVDLIAETKIHQYYKDGVVTSRNRFTGEWEECFIRGAKFRTFLYGFGASADFIAHNYLDTVNGEFLWGPGEITPAVCVLERLSEKPRVVRKDIPIVSISNTTDVNIFLKSACEHVEVFSNPSEEAYKSFVGKYRRWCGNLEEDPDLEGLNMVEEAGVETVNTSKDNSGDDKGTDKHQIGYVAYYKKGLLDKGPLPTLLSFHGGGDSAMYIADTSGWAEIASKYDFLLISIENHLNSTASEMIELIDKLKDKYPIDEHRLYASGFSMGGCKSWDLFQEYPEKFAALAPMDATFEVGLNVYGQPAPVEINRDVMVPVFYAGGEITPLPELPFQAEKCYDRMKYVFEVNKIVTKYDITFEDQDAWTNKIWGIDGDRVEVIHDDTRGSDLTMNYFDSADGVCRTVFASISEQAHECRPHTCEQAWKFMSRFTR